MNQELISAAISDRGLSEKRPQNEDSFAELPQFGVFAVADGVGGANAGDFASQMAMEVLTEVVSNRSESTEADELFRTAITHANRSIHQTAIDLPQLSSMATTIVALHLKGNIATIAHVGDSRIYRFTPEGQVFRETNDHSVVEEEVRAGRLTPEEALYHPSRNIISRAVGAEENVDIDIKTIMVEPNTTFLLCSDGITRHIPDEELRSIFSTGAEPRLLCEQLKQLCYNRGAEDNLTALIVRTFADAAEQVEDFDSTVPVIEEETIATARSAYAGISEPPVQTVPEISVEDTISQMDLDEVETGEFPAAETPVSAPVSVEADAAMPEVPAPAEDPEPQFVEPLADPTTDEQFLLTETEDFEQDAAPKMGSNAPETAAVRTENSGRENEFSMFGSSAPDIWEETGPSKSGTGRILISLGLLLLGGAIAVGASYYLGFTGPQQAVEPPQVETMKTQNIPLTSFEETRRTVDKDPAAYASRTSTPTDAADFYLLGRALLLSGKSVEAKRQFELARERLPQVDENERKTLSNEIALALAVIEAPQALESFKTASAAGSLTNSNNAANSPVR